MLLNIILIVAIVYIIALLFVSRLMSSKWHPEDPFKDKGD